MIVTVDFLNNENTDLHGGDIYRGHKQKKVNTIAVSRIKCIGQETKQSIVKKA